MVQSAAATSTTVVNKFAEKQALKKLEAMVSDARIQEMFEMLKQEGVLLEVSHVASDIA